MASRSEPFVDDLDGILDLGDLVVAPVDRAVRPLAQGAPLVELVLILKGRGTQRRTQRTATARGSLRANVDRRRGSYFLLFSFCGTKITLYKKIISGKSHFWNFFFVLTTFYELIL